MTSGSVDFEYFDQDGADYDPKIGYSQITDTAGDTLTITEIGDTSAVPEPPSFYLIAIGLIGIVFLAKRSTPLFG
ncbi:PEP-CTERM sorting domain-containing protein [Granulicella sp. L60]|uniref:PEP-CTERM sorting domain-containing protein n=1 Tax=Granulicella sp. L60 TaxID=1641866 RepID=UPI00131ECFC7|nr:PEP-CTERM sorting domain-containing protein [Granulicella sp. L60]